MVAGSMALPTTSASPRTVRPRRRYAVSSRVRERRVTRSTMPRSRRSSAVRSPRRAPITAWYGWRDVGTDASLSSMTCRSTTRGEPAGPVTSTAVAQPDLTRQPTTARPRTRASSSPKRSRAVRGLPPARAAGCRRSGGAWRVSLWRPWRRSSSPRRPACGRPLWTSLGLLARERWCLKGAADTPRHAIGLGRDPADPQRQRPAGRAAPLRAAPRATEAIEQRRHRVVAPGGPVAQHRGPGAEISAQLLQRHLRFHGDGRERELGERKIDRAVRRVDERALRRPVGAHGPLVELPDGFVQTGAELDQAVAPHGDDATRREHAARFRVERRAIEPVQRLRDRHQLYGVRRQPARVRRGLAIPHTGVSERGRQLRRTRVRRLDLLELLGQPDRRLAAARGAVPRHVAPRRLLRQRREQRRRVARSKRRIGRRRRGEVVAKACHASNVPGPGPPLLVARARRRIRPIKYATTARFTTRAVRRGGVTARVSSNRSSGTSDRVAMTVRYSAHRFRRHSPTPSTVNSAA